MVGHEALRKGWGTHYNQALYKGEAIEEAQFMLHLCIIVLFMIITSYINTNYLFYKVYVYNS